MFSRLLGAPVLLAAAVGVPYVATHGPNIDALLPKSPSQPATAEAAGLAQPESLLPKQVQVSHPQGPGAALYPSRTPLEGMASMSLAEVFNLNVTKEWVYHRWARKSTALSELGLFGIRVPLVTGTQLHDVAGSLTYFFDANGRAQRISFHGTAGDTTQLVMLVTQHYGLQRQQTAVAGEQLYQVRRSNHTISELRTRPAAVLWSSSPHDSFAIDLELQHPQSTTPLPTRLPPIPQSPAASQQAATSPQATAEAKSSADQPEAEPKKSPEEAWKAYFPRSRVPKDQVNSLDRRDQMW